jgi:serine/threonine protein kinase
VSSEAKDLITKMLIKSPSRRISIKAALKHEWFAKMESVTELPLTNGILNNMAKFKLNGRV